MQITTAGLIEAVNAGILPAEEALAMLNESGLPARQLQMTRSQFLNGIKQGPGEFQGPNKPYGPPERYGPPTPKYGPPEFVGPKQLPQPGSPNFTGPMQPVGPNQPPYGPPEFVGPKQPPQPGSPRFVGPMQPVGPNQPTFGPPEFVGPKQPPLPGSPNFVGPMEPIGPKQLPLPGSPEFVGPTEKYGPNKPSEPPSKSGVGQLSRLLGLGRYASGAGAAAAVMEPTPVANAEIPFEQRLRENQGKLPVSPEQRKMMMNPQIQQSLREMDENELLDLLAHKPELMTPEKWQSTPEMYAQYLARRQELGLPNSPEKVQEQKKVVVDPVTNKPIPAAASAEEPDSRSFTEKMREKLGVKLDPEGDFHRPYPKSKAGINVALSDPNPHSFTEDVSKLGSAINEATTAPASTPVPNTPAAMRALNDIDAQERAMTPSKLASAYKEPPVPTPAQAAAINAGRGSVVEGLNDRANAMNPPKIESIRTSETAPAAKTPVVNPVTRKQYVSVAPPVPPSNTFDDSQIIRSGQGGEETPLDFVRNTPIYQKRLAEQPSAEARGGQIRGNGSPQDAICHTGIIHMAVGGRTDHLPMHVKANSYVLPADVVSGMGEGNTLAGGRIIDKMFSGEFLQRLANKGAPHKAGGGGTTDSRTLLERRMMHPGQVNTAQGPVFKAQEMEQVKVPGIDFNIGPYGSKLEQIRSANINYPSPKYNFHYSEEQAQKDWGMPKAATGGLMRGNSEPPVPIVAAGGEYVIDPQVVYALGHGNMEAGHKWLDNFVKSTRAHTIKTMQKLPGPKKD